MLLFMRVILLHLNIIKKKFMKLKKAGYVPERDLVLVLTSDEETGMVSIKHIANNMAEDLNMEYAVNADALSGVLAPDGSVFGYYVQGAEKGYRSYRLTVTNPGGHSSAPRPDNAIYQLAHALIKVSSPSPNFVAWISLAYDGLTVVTASAKRIPAFMQFIAPKYSSISICIDQRNIRIRKRIINYNF